jgi:NTE family protein
LTASPRSKLALVMSGGGARAAYQVGFLRCLARRWPGLSIPILTGVSAGGINATFLAARTEGFASKVDELSDLWHSLTVNKVFRTDIPSTLRNALHIGFKLFSGGAIRDSRPYALVDTSPLRSLLGEALGAESGRLPGIEDNLRRGGLRAVAVTTSSYSTGQSITWVQGGDIEMWDRAHRRSVKCEIGLAHVMASAALPIFFPAVEIEGRWYGDGGLRLTAPLSPAVHLGADRILAISTRYGRTRYEADLPVVSGYPPPAQIMGLLYNAIFLDLFDADALAIERINRLVELIPEAGPTRMRPVRLLALRPSRDLGKLANEYERHLPPTFRFLTRGLGTRETLSNDILSLVMFEPHFLARLIELGEEDAEARREEIAAFLED